MMRCILSEPPRMHAPALPPPRAGEGGEGAPLAQVPVASPSRPPPQAGEGRRRRSCGAEQDQAHAH
jgi:hypothetical protein